MYDFLIVGAGLFGATAAYELSKAGKRCLVIDKREVVAGNCHSSIIDGIHVHTYGPHVLHTNNAGIWRFIERFTDIVPYRHHAFTRAQGKVYSIPITLMTLNQLDIAYTPLQARKYFQRATEYVEGNSIESWCLNNIGRYLYELFIKGYTEKQWQRPASELPETIIKRLPLRLDYNTEYFRDTYQGIPLEGYTKMVERMLFGSEVQLGVDFHADRQRLSKLATTIIYSGSPDELFGYDEGQLPYRSLRTEVDRYQTPDYQGVAHMNWADPDVPYHRTTEFKHYLASETQHFKYTVIIKEYAAEYDGSNEPCYPINTVENNALAQRYVARAAADEIICGGRLGTYKYLDMNQVIGQAQAVARSLV